MFVACTQFSLRPIKKSEVFWNRVQSLIEIACSKKADFILFPEYFSLSLILCGAESNFRDRLRDSKNIENEFVNRLQLLSEKNDIAIIGGSFPHMENEKILNRSWIFVPNENPIYQDKFHMTRFEAEQWKISSGRPELRLFRHAGALCAVAICYDVEFPAYCAAAAESKVDILFVPSCTDDIHGYWRVRHCASARAIENQCFVAMSSIVEGNKSFPEIGLHYGKGALLSPCDIGMPEGGIIKEGTKNKEGVAVAPLDLGILQKIRREGTVLNLRDSHEKCQFQPIS